MAGIPRRIYHNKFENGIAGKEFGEENLKKFGVSKISAASMVKARVLGGITRIALNPSLREHQKEWVIKVKGKWKKE